MIFSKSHAPNSGYHHSFSTKLESLLGTLAQSALDSLNIVVNVFNGSSRATVKYQMNDTPSIIMERTPMPDPSFIKLSEDYKDFFKSSNRASISEHVWTAPMPNNLPVGMHVITVETTDQHGQTFKSRSIFEIK